MNNEEVSGLLDAASLISRHLEGTLDADGEAHLNHWLAQSSQNQNLFNSLKEQEERNHAVKQLYDYDTEAALLRVRNKRPRTGLLHVITRHKWWAVAATVAGLALAVAVYSIWDNDSLQVQVAQAGISPAVDRARLELANGQSVELDTLKAEQELKLASVSIRKNNLGTLVIHEDKLSAESMEMNMIQTPRGGKYQVILADGTQVWLNAESFIRFPSGFAAGKREVETGGEVYFEVAHRQDAQNHVLPFIVRSGTQRIQVLGTHFDVSAYKGESIRTTLLEGKVRIEEGSGVLMMEPGSEVINRNGALSSRKADVESVMAWKEGVFYFDQQPLRLIMNQLSRWYDVDIEYRDDVQNERFSGTVSRSGSVADVLGIMEETGVVHFKITGRRIIVTR